MAEQHFHFQSFPHYVDKNCNVHNFNILLKFGICEIEKKPQHLLQYITSY